MTGRKQPQTNKGKPICFWVEDEFKLKPKEVRALLKLQKVLFDGLCDSENEYLTLRGKLFIANTINIFCESNPDIDKETIEKW